MAEEAQGVLPEFLAWMAAVGIEHSDAVRLVGGAAGALGVQATRDIQEGERLCTIPKAACISIRTTELADVIEQEELGGGLGLVLAVMHELSLGVGSKWHGYFRALPQREYLPLFWTDGQLALLQGTELEGKVQADREAAAEDFREHVLPLLGKYPGRLRQEGVSLQSFQVAASYVASRAFGVDEWHGDAMVPLADIFNHKASVVELGEGYEVHGALGSSDEEAGTSDEEGEEEAQEGDSEGEEEAGEEEEEGGRHAAQQQRPHKRRRRLGGCAGGAGCTHDHDHAHEHGQPGDDAEVAEAAGGDTQQEQSSDSGSEDGGASQLPAVMGGGTVGIYGITTANGLHLRLEMGIVDRDEDTLEIVAASAVTAGTEVHNTYGELGNAELVKKYGFALRHNPFTAVTLDKPRLLAAAAKVLGPRAWKARSKLLREETEVLDEEEEPFEALPNGHISPALYVALRVLGATGAELASWDGIAAALRLPRRPAAGAAGAGSGAGEGCASEDEGDEEAQLGAVQAWQVLDADGQPLDAAATLGSAEAAASSGAQALQGGARLQQQGQQEQEQLRDGHAALLPASMWRLLHAEVVQRQAAYATTLEADLTELEKRQAAAAAAPAGEGDVAERAALLLRLTEKEVLRDLELALQRRLHALAAGSDEKAVAQEEAAGAEQGGGDAAAGAAGKGRRRGGVGKAAGPKRKQQ